MNRVTLAIIIFFSIALGLYWQAEMKRSQQASVVEPSIEQPDFTAHHLRSTTFNEQGEVESYITAAYMEHFDSQQTTSFIAPVFHLYPKETMEHWRVSAKQGTHNQANHLVTLEKDVIIDGISQNEPIEQLTTSYLDLNLDTMILTSNRTIHILGDGFTIEGSGLHADLNTEQIELKQQVSATYDPD